MLKAILALTIVFGFTVIHTDWLDLPRAIDYTCVNQCVASGKLHGYCIKQCSF